jgi:osmotically inducible lipoprotein OsmB
MVPPELIREFIRCARRNGLTWRKPARTRFKEGTDSAPVNATRMLVDTCESRTSKEIQMKTRVQASIAATLFALVMGGCADMSREEKGAIAGAAVGAVAGHAVSHGDGVGTAAGAVAGGVIGHEVAKRY